MEINIYVVMYFNRYNTLKWFTSILKWVHTDFISDIETSILNLIKKKKSLSCSWNIMKSYWICIFYIFSLSSNDESHWCAYNQGKIDLIDIFWTLGSVISLINFHSSIGYLCICILKTRCHHMEYFLLLLTG